jgi:hypothetical protein
VGETVKCQIRGLEQDMKTLTLENLNPFIDLKDATQDQIAVSVEFGIDENTYEVVSTPLVTLKIQ